MFMQRMNVAASAKMRCKEKSTWYFCPGLMKCRHHRRALCILTVPDGLAKQRNA